MRSGVQRHILAAILPGPVRGSLGRDRRVASVGAVQIAAGPLPMPSGKVRPDTAGGVQHAVRRADPLLPVVRTDVGFCRRRIRRRRRRRRRMQRAADRSGRVDVATRTTDKVAISRPRRRGRLLLRPYPPA